MGNAESDHRDNSDGEDEAYDYHKPVLKEGSTPAKGSALVHLPETPESSNSGFEDAREDVQDDDDVGNNVQENDTNSGSFIGSEGSFTGSSHSGSGSLDKLSGSYTSQSSHTPERSHDRSQSSPSPEKSVATGSESSSGSLPNRIRVIDTSESENEEEETVSSSANPRKQLDFSDKHNVSKRQHKHLPRPIPIHKSSSDSSQSQGPSGDDVPGRSQPVKRKADDMEPEPEEIENEMAVPVRRTGGVNRPFARKRELRDIVLGRQMSDEPVAGTSDTQRSLPGNEQTAKKHQSHEKMDETENGSGNAEKATVGFSAKFEHSNNSPFKNFHLQPSSSTAGADLSATAETPKEKTGTPQGFSLTNGIGTKRSNSDPDPSTSTAAEEGENSGTSSQTREVDKPSVSGLSNGFRSEHRTSPRVMPTRGNVTEGSSRSPRVIDSQPSGSAQGNDRTVNHWTSELPRVNVAATEKRYEGVSVARHSPAPSTSDWQNTVLRHEGDRFSFMLADTLNVHICYDDITKLRTDALINPTDGQLTHVNNIARNIAMATGPQMTNQCQFFLRQNGGPLETTEVIETYACGSLSGRVGHVVHLATPTYEVINEKSSVNKLLKSYLNCLNHINDKLGLVSVVFPCIGAGSYPQDTCINVFFESLLIHLAERKTSCIKTIKFVVTDVHLGNLAIAMIQAHLERGILEGIDVLMADALNSYYGNSKWECTQNDENDQLGRQMEVDSPKKLFRGPPVKRPKL